MTTVPVHHHDPTYYENLAAEYLTAAEEKVQLAEQLVQDIYYEPLEEEITYRSLVDNMGVIFVEVAGYVRRVRLCALKAERARRRAKLPPPTVPSAMPVVLDYAAKAWDRAENLLAAAEEFRPNL